MEMQMYKQASLHVGWEKLLNNSWMEFLHRSADQQKNQGKVKELRKCF